MPVPRHPLSSSSPITTNTPDLSSPGSSSSSTSLSSSISDRMTDPKKKKKKKRNKNIVHVKHPRHATTSTTTTIRPPSGAFCFPRPSLDEVLANTAPAPYTLSAFMAYLSQNHCLENLEFTLDVKRYRQSYEKWIRLPSSGGDARRPEDERMRLLWQRLLTVYIVPGAPHEVNLTSHVRDGLLAFSDSAIPPSPQVLDSAMKRIYELMQESIFIPFLNSKAAEASVVPFSAPPFPFTSTNNNNNVAAPSSAGDDSSSSSFPFFPGSFDEGGLVKRFSRTLAARSSPDSSSRPTTATATTTATTNSTSADRVLSKNNESDFDDDDIESVQLSRDSSSIDDPMTPPATPPSSSSAPPSANFLSTSHNSPKTKLPWKKMGKRLGFKRR